MTADRFKLAGLAGVVAGAAWQWHGAGMLAAGVLVFVTGWAMALTTRGKAAPDERS